MGFLDRLEGMNVALESKAPDEPAELPDIGANIDNRIYPIVPDYSSDVRIPMMMTVRADDIDIQFPVDLGSERFEKFSKVGHGSTGL